MRRTPLLQLLILLEKKMPTRKTTNTILTNRNYLMLNII
jgi:hypothetical protein